AGSFQVVGGPDGSRGHDFDFAEVAAGFFGAFADKPEAPVDQVGVGKLEDDAVADASGRAQGFGAVAGNPDAGNFAVGPGKFCGDAIKIHGIAGVQAAKDADKFLEIFEGRGFLAEDAAGTVATTDAELHAAVGSEIQRGEEARGDGDVADGGIGDAGTKTHFLGVGGHEGEERKRLLPDDVGIENP